MVKYNAMDLLHLDDSLLVTNKPAGLPVLPDGWDKDAPYLLRQLEAEHGKLYVVHRLDKQTSGVLVLARTAEAHRTLSLQFERHQALKIYHALANGNPPWTERTTRQPLRGNVGHKHRTIVDRKDGKASQTTFRILQHYRGFASLEAQPLTGRTHQVRAHAAALGYPLIGDVLYGAPKSDLIARPALHAYSLTLLHPATGEQVTFTAPYPPDFAAAVERLKAM